MVGVHFDRISAAGLSGPLSNALLPKTPQDAIKAIAVYESIN